MIMTRRKPLAQTGAQRGYAGFIDRLNARLLPLIGPPPLGPYDEEAVPAKPPTCPLCGSPMSEHRIDRSGERTQLHCP
ncbi:ribosomal protein S27AE [Agromyces ramosus]|uniref:Ribosomal protein S27AE n=2 Tax=Agromyces ramosus TaxID=33879 RepID=A0ABU0R7V6_9MICO|nr:ribosomal protein S27AE [Agromyces ramosus]